MADYTIKNDCLTLRVASRGAEMQSLTDAKGRERLWQGDPAYWTGRAPVLFPIAGGLRDGCFLHDGKRYDLTQRHGFARTSEFECEDAVGDRLTFLLDRFVPEYPFRYEFRVTYALEDESVRVTYQTKNIDDRTLCFGVGAHEAYALEDDLKHYTLLFDEEEQFNTGLFEGGLLTHETALISRETRRLPLNEELMARFDTVMIQNVRSRGVTLVSDLNDRSVRVEFPDFPYLLLWKKPGARYLCIEPWVNQPDYTDGDLEFARKIGIVSLAPGEERAFTHRIMIR